MASESLMFVTGSKTLEITDYSIVKSASNKNGIQSERFTVGGYEWVISFYPHGLRESVSVYVNRLNTIKQVQAMFSFQLLNWTTSKWLCRTSTDLITFRPGSINRWGFGSFIQRSVLEASNSNYLKDDKLSIKCTLWVNLPLPPPAPALKPDDNYPTGADISLGNDFHTASYAPPNAPSNTYTNLPRQPTVRIYCEAAKDLSITARNGTVVLAPADSNDHYQHWIKDMNSFNEAKDSYGFPIFALVNRVTKEALKNPAGENQEVSLVPYNQDSLDNSVKWTEVGSTGFRAIRITSMPTLNMTAVAKDDGIFNDGSKIIVQRWGGDTPIQHWKMVPYSSNVPY